MLKMGCSKADITPGFPCFLRGYASRTELTEQVEDPIEVGVIALEQDSTRQIILTVDSLATAEADCQSIRREIEQRFDIAPQNVVIACSHSHFAPEMCGFTISTGGGMPWGNYPADERFRNFWMARVMPAIEQALNDLEAVELLTALASLEQSIEELAHAASENTKDENRDDESVSPRDWLGR